MAYQHGPSKEEVEAFIEWIRHPLPTFVNKWDLLSPREKEVLNGLVCFGKTLREVAMELGIAHQTAKNYAWKSGQKTGLTPTVWRDQFLIELRKRAYELSEPR